MHNLKEGDFKGKVNSEKFATAQHIFLTLNS